MNSPIQSQDDPRMESTVCARDLETELRKTFARYDRLENHEEAVATQAKALRHKLDNVRAQLEVFTSGDDDDWPRDALNFYSIQKTMQECVCDMAATIRELESMNSLNK